MEIDFSVPQTKYSLSEAEYVAAVAGFGSGKTFAAASNIVAKKVQYPELDQAYLAPTYALIKSIFYPAVTELLSGMGLKPKKDFTINKSDHIININGANNIRCFTMDDPDMLVGWEVADATMDEYDLLPVDKAMKVMRKVSARCRQKKPDGKVNQKRITTTPEGYKATYKQFQKDKLDNSELITMSTYSNEDNLPPGYIEGLKKQYPSQLVDAYILGKFVNLTSGSVYPEFDRELNNTVAEIRNHEPLHVGMDFNVYKMYGGVHVIRGGLPLLLEELVNVKDTPSMIVSLKQRYSDHNIIVYPDASGDNKSSKGASLSDIVMLREAGFNISAPTKNPRVRDRVNSVNAKFCNNEGERSYLINVEKCPVATECFEQQIYDKNGEPDKSSDQDHPPDGNGYFIHRTWPILANPSDIIVTTDYSDELNYEV